MEQGKTKKPRRFFDQQFKVDAVRLASESGKSVAEVARELGINRNVLDRWKRALGKKGAAAAAGRPAISRDFSVLPGRARHARHRSRIHKASRRCSARGDATGKVSLRG